MSTPQSSPDKQPPPESNDQTPPAQKPKRSLGFIESTDFQPSWLETGPLSPEMLAALKEQAEVAVKNQVEEPIAISGGYTQRLAALEKLYEEQEGRRKAEDDPPAAQTAAVPPPSETATPTTTDSVPASELSVAAEGATDEQRDSQPHTDPEDSLSADAPARVNVEATEATEPALEQSIEAEASPGPDAVPASAYPTGRAVVEDVELPAEPEAVVDSILTGARTTADAPSVEATVPHAHPLFDKLARRLLILGLLFTGLALVTLLFNPFQRVALGTATLARPFTTPDVASPDAASGAWCLAGELLGPGQEPLPMSDSGANGDVVAGDNIYAVEFAPQQTGSLNWQVIDCADESVVFPPAGAWVQATDGEPATFFFDSNRREDPLFFAIPYVVTALDGSSDFRLVGSFQGWDPDDPTNRLERVGPGIYQQVRQIDRPGRYEAYAIAGNLEQAIDAYGRNSDPIPFTFELTEPNDYAVFLVDTNRGRASVLYDMPRLMTSMAYGNSYRLITALLGLIGLTLLGWMLARMAIMGNQSRWLDAGCPQCGQHELIRVSRQSQDRLAHLLGLPTYRYQCRVCTWQGAKLSEGGSPVSPGATITVNDLPRQRFR